MLDLDGAIIYTQVQGRWINCKAQVFWINVKFLKKRQCIGAVARQRILPETGEQKRLFAPKWSSRTLVRKRSQTPARWRRQRARTRRRAALASQVSRPHNQLLFAFLRPRAEIHATGLKINKQQQQKKNSLCSVSPVIFFRLRYLRVNPTFPAHLTTPRGLTLTPVGRITGVQRRLKRFQLIIGCK